MATNRQVLNFRFDSSKGVLKSLTHFGFKEEIKRPKKSRKLARDHVVVGSKLTQSERNKIDFLNVEGNKSKLVNIFTLAIMMFSN